MKIKSIIYLILLLFIFYSSNVVIANEDITNNEYYKVFQRNINKIINEQPYMAIDDIANSLMRSGVELLKLDADKINIDEFILVYKNLTIKGTPLPDLKPNYESVLRNTYRTAIIKKVNEININIEAQTNLAKKEFWNTVFTNPNTDMVKLAQQIVQKYHIEAKYGEFLEEINNYKNNKK